MKVKLPFLHVNYYSDLLSYAQEGVKIIFRKDCIEKLYKECSQLKIMHIIATSTHNILLH